MCTYGILIESGKVNFPCEIPKRNRKNLTVVVMKTWNPGNSFCSKETCVCDTIELSPKLLSLSTIHWLFTLPSVHLQHPSLLSAGPTRNSSPPTVLEGGVMNLVVSFNFEQSTNRHLKSKLQKSGPNGHPFTLALSVYVECTLMP